MKPVKFISIVLLFVACFTLILTNSAFAEDDCSNAKSLKHLNWSEKRKNLWGISTLSSSKIRKKAEFNLHKKLDDKDTNSSNCWSQGGVITEYYYVMSKFCGDNSKNNYVVFADRTTKNIVKVFRGNWGHMNAFYYKWGTGLLTVRGTVKNTNRQDHGCFQFGESKSSIKELNTSDCKLQKDYGTPKFDTNGNEVSKCNAKQGRLSNQGEAVAGGYAYSVGWDSNNVYHGQRWGWKKHANTLFIFDKANKILLKTYYLPSPKKELEDVSIDGDGNIWLNYNMGNTKVAFYEIKRSDLDIPPLGSKPSTPSVDDSIEDDPGVDVGDEGEPDENDPNADNGSSNGDNSNDPASPIIPDDTSNNSPDSQEPEGTQTAILNDNGIEGILNLILEILTYGVAIAGVVGITITGIQYLTAKGDETKATKAKRRFFEIVIGLALYATLYAILKFLNVFNG